jgi:hypothetical protein
MTVLRRPCGRELFFVGLRQRKVGDDRRPILRDMASARDGTTGRCSLAMKSIPAFITGSMPPAVRYIRTVLGCRKTSRSVVPRQRLRGPTARALAKEGRSKR